MRSSVYVYDMNAFVFLYFNPFLIRPHPLFYFFPIYITGVAECISGSIVKEKKGCHAHPFMEDGRPFVYHDRRQNKTAIVSILYF